MPYCRNCGAELEETAQYCSRCGTKVNDGAKDSSAEQEEKAGLNVGLLVWSIINVFLLTVLGVIALVFTVIASDKSGEEAKNNIKIARILNILATVMFFVGIALFVFFMVVIVMSSLSFSEVAYELTAELGELL